MQVVVVVNHIVVETLNDGFAAVVICLVQCPPVADDGIFAFFVSCGTRRVLDHADGGGGRARCVQRWPPGEQGRLPVHPCIHARLEQSHVEEPNATNQGPGEWRVDLDLSRWHGPRSNSYSRDMPFVLKGGRLSWGLTAARVGGGGLRDTGMSHRWPRLNAGNNLLVLSCTHSSCSPFSPMQLSKLQSKWCSTFNKRARVCNQPKITSLLSSTLLCIGGRWKVRTERHRQCSVSQ